MKYLSIIVLILLCGCKDKKITPVAEISIHQYARSSDTLYLDTTKSTAGHYAPTGLYIVGNEPRMKSGWLQGREYDRPKKRKKKEFNWGTNWKYRDTTNGGKYYDSSYTITWDSSGHQFGGGIQAVPKGYKSKDKDVYDYSVLVPFDTLPHHDYEGAEMYPRGTIVFSDPNDRLVGDTRFINKWIDSFKFCREWSSPLLMQYSQDSTFKWGDNTYKVINGKSHLIRHTDYVGPNGGPIHSVNIVDIGSDNHPDGEIRRFKKSKKGSYNIGQDTIIIKADIKDGIGSNLFYHCLLMDNTTGLVILDTLINKYEFNIFFNYHKTH